VRDGLAERFRRHAALGSLHTCADNGVDVAVAALCTSVRAVVR
jgi:hypothetical protein